MSVSGVGAMSQAISPAARIAGTVPNLRPASRPKRAVVGSGGRPGLNPSSAGPSWLRLSEEGDASARTRRSIVHGQLHTCASAALVIALPSTSNRIGSNCLASRMIRESRSWRRYQRA